MPRTHRHPTILARMLTAGTMLLTAGFALAGCTADHTPAATHTTRVALPAPEAPEDAEPGTTPVADQQGTGTTDLRVSGLADAHEMTVAVVCTPAAAVTVRAFGNFFSGTCSRRGEVSAGFPVPAATTTTTVRVEVGDHVDFHLTAYAD